MLKSLVGRNQNIEPILQPRDQGVIFQPLPAKLHRRSDLMIGESLTDAQVNIEVPMQVSQTRM